jgi:hypothetical protein
MDPEATGEADAFALWLHSVNARHAESSSPTILVTVLSIAAFGLGVAIVLIFFLFGKRKTSRSKRTAKKY